MDEIITKITVINDSILLLWKTRIDKMPSNINNSIYKILLMINQLIILLTEILVSPINIDNIYINIIVNTRNISILSSPF